MVKFGLSTRLYLFGGPEELRPEEGLSKQQKKQLAALEVMLEIKQCDCVDCFVLIPLFGLKNSNMGKLD